ncbi:MAG: hypothetical protein NE334_00315 [Lentisphaeraceae bacterium]|nr:hypothetical protein [Lentisphaeraceae bacterium]
MKLSKVTGVKNVKKCLFVENDMYLTALCVNIFGFDTLELCLSSRLLMNS